MTDIVWPINVPSFHRCAVKATFSGPLERDVSTSDVRCFEANLHVLSRREQRLPNVAAKVQKFKREALRIFPAHIQGVSLQIWILCAWLHIHYRHEKLDMKPSGRLLLGALQVQYFKL